MGPRNMSSDDEEEIDEREEDVEDNEAAVDDDEDDDEEEEEEEEEEEGQNEYEKDDFIVDEVEEEEEEEEAIESSDEEAKAKKKKRKKRDAEENYELDEDDYELLQEANVTGIRRSNKTKFKRLKKAGKVSSEGGRAVQTGFSDDEDLEEGNRHGRTAEEELKRTLFGDDEGAPPEDIGEEEEVEEEEEDIGEEDEMADFIVDEEDVDENGQPVRRSKARRKGPPKASGISSLALQEAQEIFGDVTELLDRRKFGLNGNQHDEEADEEGYRYGRPKKKLEDEFEPSVLEEKYMTEKDNRIRDIDVPERLQLLEEVTGPIPVKEPNNEEAEWIYDQCFGFPFKILPKEYEVIIAKVRDRIRLEVSSKLDLRGLSDREAKELIQRKVTEETREIFVPEIEYVLTQLHDYKLEIPFIGMYRKEGCIHLVGDPVPMNGSKEETNLRDFKLLWQIFAMDKRWWSLQHRKNVLAEAYEKRARFEAEKDPSNFDLLKRLIGSLQEARSLVAVDDVDAKYNLHFPPDEDVEQGQFRRPKRRSLYNIYRKDGFGVIARRFGLTAEQFGENLQAFYKRHEVEDSSSMPEDIASEYIQRERTDPISVLKGARHMAAVEISSEPAVREYVRNVFTERAVVNTRPTKEGNAIIDVYHDYAVVKWIVDKPVNGFKDGQWLIIQKAEEEKLIEVTISLPKSVLDSSIIQEFETYYLSDGVSRTAQLWNDQRRKIISDAVKEMLLPLVEKEVRMLLTIQAKQWVARECGNSLWNKVAIAPWGNRHEEHTGDDEAPRVLAACYGGSLKPPTTFVMLDSSGEVLNTLYTPHLVSESVSSEHDPRKHDDLQRLSKFLIEYQPEMVVVGAVGQKSLSLRREITKAIWKLVEDHPQELGEEGAGLENVNKDLVDESLARIYEASNVSKEQLPGQPGIVRRATYLGRYLQNPLAMVAALCGPNREILSCTLHKMQSFLTDDERYDVIQQVMVCVTNQVGVDINMAAAHEWLFAPLQFVCGLGPRKASAIQRSIQGVGRISTRKEMLTSLRLMKKTVFINACAFLRIRSSGQAASGNQIMDPLDDTRIHPESYELAKSMAETAYKEHQKANYEDAEEEVLEMAVEHVKDNPILLTNVDVRKYSDMVEESNGVSKFFTLQDIVNELLHGYKEWRYPYNSPSEEELFTLMTGENDDTMGVGRLVTVRVKEVTPRGIKCDMGNGLPGFIQKDDFSDESGQDFDLRDHVSVGSMLTCRIKNIRKNIMVEESKGDSKPPRFYSVDLTCKDAVMKTDDWEKVRMKEPYFSQEAMSLHREEEKAKKAKDDAKKQPFKPRMIVHPQFQNVSISDAIEALSGKDVGEIIIRPSSKGPSNLSITLKVYDGIYTHIDIVEGGKDGKDVRSLGKSLKIGEETFEDLDEVIACYVDPLVSNLKEMLRYRKFRRGKRDEIDALLKQEKAQNPLRIVYAISVSYEHQGAFMLSYLRSSNVHHEYISLYPKGYKFRKRMFENIDKLVGYFQKHVNDTVPVEANRSLAAMVPMKSPAPGAAGWGAAERPVSSGWQSGGWNSARNFGHTNWERSPSIGSRAPIPPGTNWGGGWGRGAGEGLGDGWARNQHEYYGGRGERADVISGGGRFNSGYKPEGRFGRGDNLRGGFGGRGGRNTTGRGGRWGGRDGGINKGNWVQSQGNPDRGNDSSWGIDQGGATPRMNDDGWGVTQTSEKDPAQRTDGTGWGQATDKGGERDGGWGPMTDGWGQAERNTHNNSGWNQKSTGKDDDGWGQPTDGPEDKGWAM